MGSSPSRKLPIEDAPETKRVMEGEMINELPDRLNTNITTVILQLEEASHGTSHGVYNVQILLNLIEGCNLQ